MSLAERVYQSKDYDIRIRKAEEAFDNLFLKAAQSSNHPPTLKDYSPYEGFMLGVQLAMVLDTDLLKLSQCSHRAVSATLSLHLETPPTRKQRDMSKTLLWNNKVIGNFYDTHDGSYLVIHGNNNWRSQELDPTQILDCKIMPGHPTEVGRENLLHLSEDKEVKADEEIDNACPKRTKGTACNIIHAEAAVINSAKEVVDCLQLSPSSKTILTSTWVPCPKCVNLITSNHKIFGSKIDVFSVYKAYGDDDDDRMARVIQKDLHKDSLGRLAGPFISLPKTVPGYGWWPAKAESNKKIQNQLSLVKPTDESRTLSYALSLLTLTS